MSHFTKLKTVIRDQVVLCDALRQLHHEFREGENLTVRGYQGSAQTAQVVVQTGCAYDIGFQRQPDQTYAAVSDWDYGIRREAARRFQQDAFLAEVNQKYAHLRTRIEVQKQVQEKGWLIEEERVLPNGEVEIIICEPI